MKMSRSWLDEEIEYLVMNTVTIDLCVLYMLVKGRISLQ